MRECKLHNIKEFLRITLMTFWIQNKNINQFKLIILLTYKYILFFTSCFFKQCDVEDPIFEIC